jgi:phosphohistidine phosphatase SixA
MVRLVLVRHGDRERDGGELAPLTPGGRWQAEGVAAWLDSIELLRPQLILCSRSRHAHEHAEIVCGLLVKKVPVVPVTALTPHTPESEFTVQGMLRDGAAAMALTGVTTITCIGHEPRLQQLTEQVTGTQPEVLQFGESVAIEGDSWQALERGKGQVMFRHLPAGSPGDDTDLHDKIQSKMQTSALLAGFTSTVFGVVLTQSDYWTIWGGRGSWPTGADAWKAAAVAACLFFLALATLLFVVSIYMYDRLAMPRRYWDAPADDRPPAQDLWRSFRRNRVRHGLLYAYMVWVWRSVFSVAVAMAMFGFLALVLYRGVWSIAVLYVLATSAVVTYYLRFRPELGVD